MNKHLANLAPKSSFADFAAKLAARWGKQTTSSSPDQPQASSRSGLEDIFSQLVAYPTVTGNFQANHDALDYIEQFLDGRGLYIRRYLWNNVESLIVTTRKTKTPKLLLGAHLDVLPADEKDFTLRKEQGKYFGRGTLDMKFAIASYLKAIDELGEDTGLYDIGLLITTDEEAGGTDGVARIIDEGYLPKVCVLPDGGDNWQIQLYAKGFLYLSVTASGKPAHGSRPWLGDNAIAALTDTIHDVRQLFVGHNAETNTLNIGKISGGEAINQVARSAEALLDIRVINEKEKARLLKAIEEICRKRGADFSVVIDGTTCEFSLKDPYIASFAQTIEETVGITVTGSRTLGTSDARFFAKQHIPCISIYPQGGGHHGPQEWIAEKGLQQFYEVILAYMKRPEFRASTPRPRRLAQKAQ